MPDFSPATAEERRLAAQHAINTRWARTPDRTAATAPARTAFDERFERQVDPDGTLAPDVRAKLAANARTAFFADLARRSAKARRLAAAARDAESELRRAHRAAELGVDLTDAAVEVSA